MKAVGMPPNKIRQIFLFKYIAVGGTAAFSGYLISLCSNRLLMANSMLYLGKAPAKLLTVSAPAVSAAFIFLFILFSVSLILRRFKRITVVQALQAGDRTVSLRRSGKWELKRCGRMNINVFLGIRNVFISFRKFGLLTFVFIISSFIIILPVNFLTTISSTEFISYMGIGRCDIRIDLHHTDKIRERFELMIEAINKDPQIEAYSPLVTSQFNLIQENGENDILIVETGDFSVFPLDYMNGREPQNSHEIALSYLNSRDLNKNTGDILVLEIEGEQQDFLVCGVYQDITNGGHSAKAAIPYNENKVLWYTLSLNLKKGVSIPEKVGEYSSLFSPARVTDMESYLSQTLGNTIVQVKKITITAIIIGLSVAMLITSLFLRMMISRDKGRIAAMRSLGFSLGHIRLQYLAASLFLLIISIIGGTVFTNSAGEALVSFLVSFMGAARIEFIINPLLSSLLLPVLLIGTVSLTTVISIKGIKDYTITAAIAE
jgi:putative ABC transport system permease protein